jgi:hypothetical protein
MINAFLYQNADCFTDVTQGTNAIDRGGAYVTVRSPKENHPVWRGHLSTTVVAVASVTHDCWNYKELTGCVF